MNDKQLQSLFDRLYPEVSEPVPRRAMWHTIREQVSAIEEAPRPGFQILAPAVGIGAAGLALAIFVLVENLHVSDDNAPPPDRIAQQMEALRETAPQAFELNKPALDALAVAIEEVQADLQALPGDKLLHRRLEYYSEWHSEMISGLVRSRDGGPDASG